jgi:MFS family permease
MRHCDKGFIVSLTLRLDMTELDLPKNAPSSPEFKLEIPQITGVHPISPLKTLVISMGLSFIGVGTMVFYTSMVASMDKLNKTLAFLLGISPLFTTTLNQIPLIHCLNQGGNGVKKVILASTVPAVIGGFLAAITAAITDITQVNDFNWAYLCLLIAGLCLGFGSGLFTLVVLALRHTAKEGDLALRQAIFSAFTNSSYSVIPVLFSILRGLGFSTIYTTYSVLLAISGILALTYAKEAPYQQLLKMNYSKTEAKQLAIENFGQIESMINGNNDAFNLKKIAFDYLKTAWMPQGRTLIGLELLIYGSSLFMATNFPAALKQKGISEANAIYICAGSVFISEITRVIAGKLMTKLSARNTYCLGSVLSVIASFFLAFIPNASINLIISMVILFNIGIGFSILPPCTLLYDWAKPINTLYKPYDPLVMMGLIFAIGTAGGIFLSIISGMLLDSFGQQGFQ